MGKFFLAVLAIALLVYAIFDCIACPRHQIRGRLPKVAWFVVIIIVPVVGPLLWLMVGHRRTWNPPAGGNGGRRAPRPPSGPDDDPDYLRGL